LTGSLSGVALRTLDAIHLALAVDAGARELATADAVMMQAAKRLGLAVHGFG